MQSSHRREHPGERPAPPPDVARLRYGKGGWPSARRPRLHLLSELDDPTGEPFEALAPGTVMGHVQLKVSCIAETIAFNQDGLGSG